MKKQEKLKEEIKELIDKGAELGAYLNFDEQTKSCPRHYNRGFCRGRQSAEL